MSSLVRGFRAFVGLPVSGALLKPRARMDRGSRFPELSREFARPDGAQRLLTLLRFLPGSKTELAGEAQRAIAVH